MAAKRAAFSLRRRTALGFSKRRRSRNFCKVRSRSSFFLRRRMARSTGSPFFSFTSVIIQNQLVAQQGLAGDALLGGAFSSSLAAQFACEQLAAFSHSVGERVG